jgi:hypothetical protein
MSEPRFAADIAPLFREHDVTEMAGFFDLRSLHDVRAHAAQILDRVDAGSMPCDGMWTEEQVDLFRRWIDAGMYA